MPVSKKKQEELAKRRRLVATFLELGLSGPEVAEVVGCTASDVANDRVRIDIRGRSEKSKEQQMLALLIFWLTQRDQELLMLLERHREVIALQGFVRGLIAHYESLCIYPRLEGGYQALFEALFGWRRFEVPGVFGVLFEVVHDRNSLDELESVEDLRNYIAEVFRRMIHVDRFVTRFEPRDIKAQLDAAIDTLTERQAEIIARRFGLRGFEKSSLRQVAEHFDLTRERVREIEAKALRKLRDRHVPNIREHIETVASLRSERDRLLGEVKRLEAQVHKLETGEQTDPSIPKDLDLSVDELELSVRAANCLEYGLCIRYIGELVQKTETQLLKTKNMGRKSLREIKEALVRFGLTLGMSFPDWSPPKVPHQRASTSDPYPHP